MRRPLSRPLSFCLSLLLLAVFAGLPGCGDQDAAKKQTEAKPAEPPAVMVQAKKPVVADVPVYGEFVGRVAAKENIEVRARVEGYLKERNFTEGARSISAASSSCISSAPSVATNTTPG